MKILRISTILFLAIVLCSSCTMKGYQIDLRIDRQDQVLDRIRELLRENGFERAESLASDYDVERYRKDPPEIGRSFWNRNADYSVRVDINYGPPGRVKKSPGIEVWIYNAYIGNSPEIKPYLTKTADSIEEAIRKTVPGIEIQRSERLAGVPFI